MTKRIHLLDRITIFQSPEWTSELLEELSYLLVEQRYTAGSPVYNQGDKALQIYFIVRGEIIVTKTMTDPKTHKTYSMFVERRGPYSLIGGDA